MHASESRKDQLRPSETKRIQVKMLDDKPDQSEDTDTYHMFYKKEPAGGRLYNYKPSNREISYASENQRNVIVNPSGRI